MSVQDIMRFPLPPLYDDCLLFLWRLASMQQEALDVAYAWGFTIKAEMVWEKLTKGDPPVQAFGLGRYVRNCHEVCLIGTRGRVGIRDHSVRSSFSAPLGSHSEKPEEFYRRAARLAGGPRAELFARRHRRGWQCDGNELKSVA
jgi:site-specific DNA-methyltransferase (adenine-specific)